MNHPLQPPGKEEARFTFVQDDDEESDKRGVRLSEAYVVTTAIGGKDEEGPTTEQDFLEEKENDSYCPQTSFTVDFQGSTYT